MYMYMYIYIHMYYIHISAYIYTYTYIYIYIIYTYPPDPILSFCSLANSHISESMFTYRSAQICMNLAASKHCTLCIT